MLDQAELIAPTGWVILPLREVLCELQSRDLVQEGLVKVMSVDEKCINAVAIDCDELIPAILE